MMNCWLFSLLWSFSSVEKRKRFRGVCVWNWKLYGNSIFADCHGNFYSYSDEIMDGFSVTQKNFIFVYYGWLTELKIRPDFKLKAWWKFSADLDKTFCVSKMWWEVWLVFFLCNLMNYLWDFIKIMMVTVCTMLFVQFKRTFRKVGKKVFCSENISQKCF